MSEKNNNKNNALNPNDLDKVIGGIVLPKPSNEDTTEETGKDFKVGFERLDRSGDNPFFLHH